MPRLVIGRIPQLQNTDDELIFINDWCNIREHTNEKLDKKHKVAHIPIESSAEILEVIRKSRRFEDSILPRLCDELNAFHSLNGSQSYWKILIGAWLRRVIEMYFFRKYHLLRCIEKYQITKISVLSDANLVQPTFLTSDFLNFPNNELWDAQITSLIVQSLKLQDVVIEIVGSTHDSGDQNLRHVPEKPQLEGAIKLKSLLIRFLSKMQRRNNAFICNTYLSRRNEILLSLSFGQVPQFYKFEDLVEPWRPEGYNRKRMSGNLNRGYSLTDEQFLVNLIVDLFPSCYLENMPELRKVMNLMGFPANPKFIFTSNDFDTNEIFKLWSANQVDEGTPYYIGQHGNNYGVNLFFSPSVEEIVCDAFLTWGWSRDLEREIPCFNFKQPKMINKRNRKKERTSLVLFELPLENDVFSWCGIRQFENYMSDQFSFVENLSESARKELVVRLYQPKAFPAGREVVRWSKFDSQIKLDWQSNSNLLVVQTKLAVFSYDSTGILERLSLNLPVVAFWENRFFHVHNEYLDLYEKLESVGIFHASASQAGIFISQRWDNLEEWWFSADVQEVVAEFSFRLCRNSESPVRDLKQTILSLLNSK